MHKDDQNNILLFLFVEDMGWLIIKSWYVLTMYFICEISCWKIIILINLSLLHIIYKFVDPCHGMLNVNANM